MISAGASRYFYGWNIVLVSLLMNIAASPTNAVIFSFFVTPMSEDMGWSRGSLALALTARLVVAGATAPLMGVLVDRFGARILGAAAGFLAGAMMMSLYVVQELWMFYLMFAISGLSGFGGPAGQLLTTVPVAKWFHLKRGRAIAISAIGIPIGVTSFIPIVQALINATDWRTTWVILGAMVMLFSIPACLLLMRKDPESIGLYPDGATEEEFKHSTATPMKHVSDENWTVQQAVRNRAFWILLASVAVSGLVIQGTLVYRTPFWEDEGIADSIIGLGTALDPITVLFSGLLCGFLAERVAARYLGFAGFLCVAGSMVPMIIANGAVWNIFAHNILWGAAMGANLTVNNIIWPNYFGRLHLGSIRGLMFPVAIGSAAFSAPLFALLLNLLDPRYVWSVSFAGFLLAGVLMLSCRPPRLRKPAPPPAVAVAQEQA